MRRNCLSCKITLRRNTDPATPDTRVHQAKGLCSYCYQTALRSGELTARPRHEYTGTHIKCYSCAEWKEYSKFKRSGSTKSGREYRCAFCSKLWERYGLTYAAYTELFVGQDGTCAICETVFESVTAPHVDHDHACCAGITACIRCVRGLLCGPCNTGLGSFRDNEASLVKAANYLRETRVS